MNVVKEIKTYILCSVTFSKNRAIYEIMSKYMVEPQRPQTIQRVRVAYWTSMATRAQAHSPPVHPPTHTHTHMLLYTYSASLVN